MILAAIASWATAAIGLVLTYLSVRSVLYFRRQIHAAGGSWLLVVFFRTALTIAIVCGWLTLARTVTLLFGIQPWVGVISGLGIIWLLLIPPLMEREFRNHEGRPTVKDPRG